MTMQQLLAKYALEALAVEVLQETWVALGDAEMGETQRTLRTAVFGSGRCIQFDQERRCFTLRPYAELLLRRLQDIADDARWSTSTKEKKAAVAIWEAGF